MFFNILKSGKGREGSLGVAYVLEMSCDGRDRYMCLGVIIDLSNWGRKARRRMSEDIFES